MATIQRVSRQDGEHYTAWATRVHESARARVEPLLVAAFKDLLVRGRRIQITDRYWSNARWRNGEINGSVEAKLDGVRIQVRWMLVKDRGLDEARDQIALQFGADLAGRYSVGRRDAASSDAVRLVEPAGGFDPVRVVETIERWLVERKKSIAEARERKLKGERLERRRVALVEHMQQRSVPGGVHAMQETGACLLNLRIEADSAARAYAIIDAIAVALRTADAADPFVLPEGA